MSELVNTSEVAIPAVPNKNGKINLLDLEPSADARVL